MAPSEMHKCSCARTQGAHRANCHVCVLMPHHRAGEVDGCIHDFHLTTMPCTCPKPKQDPAARIELATFWLQAGCSATKLNGLALQLSTAHTNRATITCGWHHFSRRTAKGTVIRCHVCIMLCPMNESSVRSYSSVVRAMVL